MLGCLQDGRLSLEEIHRFPSAVVRVFGSLRWDVLQVHEELKAGLRKIAKRNIPIRGISVDSWGVDYVLVNAVHPMISPPFHYRDDRTAETYEKLRESIGSKLIFEETGIQFMPINTIYHLASDVERSRPILDASDCFLTIGDYFNYLFSGVACVDESLASTTQLYNPRTRSWSERLIERCGIPRKIFPKVVRPGTVLGPLLREVCAETGLHDVQVIATCSHDTGEAVAAVPGYSDDWAYLSSGTWSLIGVELSQPLINETVRAHNFTNELGYGGTTRFLKNIVGLWILQESRRVWAKQGTELDYASLNAEANEGEPFRSLINPNAARFAKAGDMPAKIEAYCRETGQPEPRNRGQFARCILESLALSYRVALDEIEELTGRSIARLHIVGGGSQSVLLNQFAANATRREVIAGPVEATAAGNVLIQAIALGQIESLNDLRGIVRDSFPLSTFQSRDPASWQDAYSRFTELTLTT
jgi:rhamnulokinase